MDTEMWTKERRGGKQADKQQITRKGRGGREGERRGQRRSKEDGELIDARAIRCIRLRYRPCLLFYSFIHLFIHSFIRSFLHWWYYSPSPSADNALTMQHRRWGQVSRIPCFNHKPSTNSLNFSRGVLPRAEWLQADRPLVQEANSGVTWVRRCVDCGITEIWVSPFRAIWKSSCAHLLRRCMRSIV